MRKLSAMAAALVLLALPVVAQATIQMDTVRIGDKGNDRDPRTGYGSVSYDYNIGTYEVTASQYTAFLNAKARTDDHGLYNLMMDGSSGCKIHRSGTSGSYTYTVADDYVNKPVNQVGFWDACRFTNWLSNGQGAGDTETGTYNLAGYVGTDGSTITRNQNWKWAVPTSNEWYKAAYYKGGSTNTGYWLYATQSDSAPDNKVLSVDPGNSANYIINGSGLWHPTKVGEFENSESAYGTYDQAGNVCEWNEAMRHVAAGDIYRGIAGGCCTSEHPSELQSSAISSWIQSTDEENWVGFRVVQSVPEPSAIIALVSGLFGMLGLRRRRC